MSKNKSILAVAGAALAASLTAHAQAPAPERAASAAAYHSAFQGYRPFSAGEVGDWRKANDTVREVGGWRTYAREISGAAYAPRSAASQPSGAPAAPPQSHSGHKP